MVEAEFQVNFIIEVRFVAADRAWLSAAAGRPSIYIGIMMYNRYEGGQQSGLRRCG
jgi:hypothetical protein